MLTASFRKVIDETVDLRAGKLTTNKSLIISHFDYEVSNLIGFDTVQRLTIFNR